MRRRGAREALRVAAWAILATAVLGSAPLSAETLGPGDPAPAFELKGVDGRTYGLDVLTGSGPVLLDFGSVFCAACQETLRRLERARREFGPRGLAVAAVNVDGAKAARAVATVTRSLDVGYPVLLDGDGAVADAYGVEVIPFLVLVDAGGTVRAVHRGPAADLAEALGLNAALAAGR